MYCTLPSHALRARRAPRGYSWLTPNIRHRAWGYTFISKIRKTWSKMGLQISIWTPENGPQSRQNGPHSAQKAQNDTQRAEMRPRVRFRCEKGSPGHEKLVHCTRSEDDQGLQICIGALEMVTKTTKMDPRTAKYHKMTPIGPKRGPKGDLGTKKRVSGTKKSSILESKMDQKSMNACVKT